MSRLSIPPAPRSPTRARIARSLFERAVHGLERLEVIAPDGRALRSQPGAPRMEIMSDAFFHRLAGSGKIGFGEAYMAEEWRSDDLAGVLSAFANRLTSLVPRPIQRLRRLYEPLQPGHERNTPDGARDNISRHYDLSNELFATFLDETMTYSCAIFAAGDTLEQAQRRKYQAMCDLIELRSGDHMLEIGTGWGGMAMHAAATSGCRVTTVTISQRQKHLAERRIREAGLDGQIEVLLCDYRDVRGRFDKIVSIEMFEAVGEEYWPEFFGICDRLLAPGGCMSLQTITMPHGRFRATRRSYTWVHKYIFPGGLIPSEPAIADALSEDLTAANRLQQRDRPCTTRPRFGCGASVPRSLGRRVRAGLRRHVPADVGVLPRLLRGRFPQRRDRRCADGAAAAMSYQGRRVWITGGSSGIGAALATELANRGARVAISARREDRLREVAGDRMLVAPVDVSSRESMVATADLVRSELGGIDIAIMNAGTWGPMDVMAWDSSAFRHHVDINLMGLVHGVEAVLTEMRRAGAGTIVGVASVAGYRGFPSSQAYGPTKAAEINLLESLRIDLMPLSIDVITVCPGFVRSELTARNSFPMPWMLEADDAARRIADGIAKRKAEIVFPLPMMLAMKSARLVPVRPWTGLMSRLAKTRKR